MASGTSERRTGGARLASIVALYGGMILRAVAGLSGGAPGLAMVALPAALVVAPAAAYAQDDAADEAPAEEGESMLVFYYRALGLRYVIVFLVLSFLLVALLVMCFLQIRRQVLIPPTLRDGFKAHLDNKEYQQAYELAKADDSYLGRVLAAGMGKLQAGYPAAVEAMQEVEAEESMKLDHKVSYISLIGALAPMFGLLGTVDGMVSAFMVIAKSATAPKPSELAIGISQALITTLIGLWLAIPAIACFALFRNWLQRLNGEVDEEALALMERFESMGTKTARGATGAGAGSAAAAGREDRTHGA
jgi:biopolymer transport protein ExbB